MPVDIKAIRRENLRFLIEKEGGNSKLSKKIQTSPSYLSQVMSLTSRGEVGNRFADQIEKALGLEKGWMSTDHSASQEKGAPMATDDDVLALAAGAKYVSSNERQTVPTTRGLSMRGFAYPVKGDEMEPLIAAGSIVIAEPDIEARSGHICVLVNSAGIFVREIAKSPTGELMLKPANARYPVAMATPDTKVVAVVRQAIRDFA